MSWPEILGYGVAAIALIGLAAGFMVALARPPGGWGRD
jgi:hypothetical protein